MCKTRNGRQHRSTYIHRKAVEIGFGSKKYGDARGHARVLFNGLEGKS